jgi:hypothetical protein
LVYGMVQLIRNSPKTTDHRVKLLLDPDELRLYESTTKPSKLCGSMLAALTVEAKFGEQREVCMCVCVCVCVCVCARACMLHVNACASVHGHVRVSACARSHTCLHV